MRPAQIGQLIVGRAGDSLDERGRLVGEFGRPCAQALGVAPAGAAGGRTDQGRADQDVHADVVAGVGIAFEPAAPRADLVDPAPGAVLVDAKSGDRELARPAVVAELAHRGGHPVGVAGAAVAQLDGQQVVALGERVELDGDQIPDGAGDRKAPAVDPGGQVLEHDPSRGPSGHRGVRAGSSSWMFRGRYADRGSLPISRETRTHATLPARDVVTGHTSVTTVDTPPRT